MRPIVELSCEQINSAIAGLPVEEKIRLTERLERETLGIRWRKILKDIDSRLKRFPLSKKNALREIACYRKEKHA